jgi:hypothetical protein
MRYELPQHYSTYAMNCPSTTVHALCATRPSTAVHALCTGSCTTVHALCTAPALQNMRYELPQHYSTCAMHYPSTTVLALCTFPTQHYMRYELAHALQYMRYALP